MRLRRYVHLLILPILLWSASIFMDNEQLVETYYTKGMYPFVSRALRVLFGWLPFSIGDFLYVAIISILLWGSIRLFKEFKVAKNRITVVGFALLRSAIALCWIWLYFLVIWGFNYSRRSIVSEFELQGIQPDTAMIRSFTAYSLEEVKRFSQGRRKTFSDMALKDVAAKAYHELSKKYPDLRYTHVSFKASLFGVLGNYMGYGGYYNPFSGEAQFNDQLPGFMLPFISLHEIAHQLGYAKESDANFIGYLASMHTADSSLRYSAHLEFFLYANSVLKKFDSTSAKTNLEQLPQNAIHDLDEYKRFTKRYQGNIDALVTWVYTRFLHINKQPEGMGSYNKGVVYAMIYMHKKNRQ